MLTFLCKMKGCDNPVSKEGDYCSQHINEPHNSLRERSNRFRRSKLYQTPEWRALRKRKLKDTGECVICGSTHQLEVHHIQPHRDNVDLFLDYYNLTVLCRECHFIITRRGRKVT